MWIWLLSGKESLANAGCGQQLPTAATRIRLLLRRDASSRAEKRKAAYESSTPQGTVPCPPSPLPLFLPLCPFCPSASELQPLVIFLCPLPAACCFSAILFYLFSHLRRPLRNKLCRAPANAGNLFQSRAK